MDVLYHRCAGLDVHAETILVCALLGEEEHIQKEVGNIPYFHERLVSSSEMVRRSQLRWRVRVFTGNLYLTF